MSIKEQEECPIVRKGGGSRGSGKLYLYSLVMGYAVLEPWNVITSCMYYFEVLYRPAGYKPQFTLPMINFLPLVGCQLLVIGCGGKVSQRVKIVLTLALLSFSSFVLVLFCRLVRNLMLNFAIAVGLTLVIGTFNGVVQSASGGLLGAMGCEGRYVGASMVGNGVSGVLSNLLELFCLGIIGHKEQDLFKSTMLFFIIVAFTMLGSIYVSYALIEDPYVRGVIRKTPHDKSLRETFKLVWPVFKGQGKNAFAIYVMTFIVFPGVLIAKHLTFLPKEWSVPMMMLIFNVFDTIGRFLPNWFVVLSSKGTTWLVFLRIISIVSICLIGYGTFNDFFVRDWWIVVNIIIFAFTNGLATTLAMMYGVNEADENDKENVGELMIFFMTGGMFAGSVVAQAVFANLF